ncbi:PQQ-binding-like beta-propeller repeat protein [Halobaculum sp. D14]|uniref:outer membrane protein assembly factor BamB family protein n=1 Tax=Halobaculum sp. D14 TaxID=3421642 RepID=UPI003EBA4D9C
MVSRRRALQLAGAGFVALAGCADGGGETPNPTDADTPTETPPATSSTPTSETPDAAGVELTGAAATWTRSFDGTLRTDPAVVADRVAVVVDTTVYGLDAASGETRWTFESPVTVDAEYGRPTASLQVHDGTLYALVGVSVGTGAHDYVLHALTPGGDERWRYESPLRKFHQVAGFGDGAAVIPTHDDAIGGGREETTFAVNLHNGTRRWRADTGDGMDGAVGRRYAAVETYGAVDCLGLAGGTHRFRYSPDGDADIGASAVGSGRLFVGLQPFAQNADGPSLVALDAASGDEQWSLRDATVSSLRTPDDLYVGGDAVLRLSPDGTERWRYDRGGLLTGVPFDDEALYTNADASVVAVDRGSGDELWSADTSDVALPRARGGDAVVSSDGGARTVYAHGVSDGDERWRATLSGEYPPTPAADADGAYLATAGGELLKVPF